MIESVLMLWSETPAALVTTRMVALQAGTAVSAIDYHFQGLGQLYAAAQRHALHQAGCWLHGRIAQMAPLAGQQLDARMQAGIIAALIDDWCEGQRPLAFAWREASAAARLDTSTVVWGDWCALWADFWRQLAGLLSLPGAADLLGAFCAGEITQHLLRWNRPLDRALLDETTGALLVHLEQGPPGPDTVRRAYASHAIAHRDADQRHAQQGGAPALDAAAASLLAEGGVAALTFRAVAGRAGVTLGQTAYHFGSKTQLLGTAFETLYRQIGDLQQDLRTVASADLLASIVEAIIGGQAPVLRALDAITLHVSRDEEHRALRGLIRGHRDHAASWVLEGLQGPGSPLPSSLAAAFSSVCRGLDLIVLGQEPAAARQACESTLLLFSTGAQVRSAAG